MTDVNYRNGIHLIMESGVELAKMTGQYSAYVTCEKYFSPSAWVHVPQFTTANIFF